MGKNVIIWGGGSQARLYAGYLRDLDSTWSLYIHRPELDYVNWAGQSSVLPAVDVFRKLQSLQAVFLVAVGGNFGFARCQIIEAMERCLFKPLTYIHPTAHIDHDVHLGRAFVSMPGAIVNKFCEFGFGCILNTGCSIDHECVVGDGVHIMGAASIAGRVKIGDFATIGTNATILPDLTIGRGAYIGAGAVVTRDVEPFSVVKGVPARVSGSQSLYFDSSSIRCLRQIYRATG